MHPGLSIDIGATKIAVAYGTPLSGISKQKKYATSEILEQDHGAIRGLAEMIHRFKREMSIAEKEMSGIVIGVPGVVDHLKQRVASCPNTQVLDGLNLKSDLEALIDCPVFVDKDTNLITYGEYGFGQGRGQEDFACIFVGSGIGCGLVLHGELYRGINGAAGEFGHTIVEPQGLECTCGDRGCVETYCSGRAFTRIYRSLVQEKQIDSSDPPSESAWSDGRKFVQLVKDGHPLAIAEIQSSFEHLGIALVNLVNILNLPLVILGGGIISGWPQGVDIVREIVSKRARPVTRDHLQITASNLGNEAGLVGGLLLLQDYLQKAGK
jgi:glucokinase